MVITIIFSCTEITFFIWLHLLLSPVRPSHNAASFFLRLSPSCVSFHSRRLMFPQRLPGSSTYRRELVTLSPIGNYADRKRGDVFVRVHVITHHVRMSELHDCLPRLPLWDVFLNVCTCHPVVCPLRIALLVDNNILAKKTVANQFKVECVIVFMFSFMVCWCKKQQQQHVQLHLLRVCLCCIHAKEKNSKYMKRRNLRNTLHFNTDRVI